jgi:hypothetical protein
VENVDFVSDWGNYEDRGWLGRDIWGDSFEAWRIERGRLVCDSQMDGVHWATVFSRSFQHDKRRIEMRVRLDNSPTNILYGAAGFVLSVPSTGLFEGEDGWHNDSVLFAGVTPAGKPLVKMAHGVEELRALLPDISAETNVVKSLDLVFTALPAGGKYTLLLQVFDAESDTELARHSLWNVPADLMHGCFGVGTFVRKKGKRLHAAFDQLVIKGADERIPADAESDLSPIVGAWYMLNRRVLNMQVQLLPVGRRLNVVKLQLLDGTNWITRAQAEIDPVNYTADFLIKDLRVEHDWPYRLEYGESLADGNIRRYYWSGTILSGGADRAGGVAVASVESGYVRPGIDVKVFYDVPPLAQSATDWDVLQRRYNWCVTTREASRNWPCLGVCGNAMTFRRVRVEMHKTAEESGREPNADWESWQGADMRVICAPDMFAVAARMYGKSGEETQAADTDAAVPNGYVKADAKCRTVAYVPYPNQPLLADKKWPLRFEHSPFFDRGPMGYLPTVEFAGQPNGVVQVLDEDDGKLVYSVRSKGAVLLPRIFKLGHYTLTAGDPDRGVRKKNANLIPLLPGKARSIKIKL